MMGASLKDKRRRVLVFNSSKRLVALFQSCTAAARAFDTATVNIYAACSGDSISSCGMYFRFYYDDQVELEIFEDLGALRLVDYDRAMGLKRKYYPNRQMSRRGMKYKKTKEKEQ